MPLAVEGECQYYIPRKDVKPQSKSLIQEFGSLKQVFDADIKDLKKIKNLSAYSAGFLMFLRKFSSLYLSLIIKQQEKINSSLIAKDFLISSFKFFIRCYSVSRI